MPTKHAMPTKSSLKKTSITTSINAGATAETFDTTKVPAPATLSSSLTDPLLAATADETTELSSLSSPPRKTSSCCAGGNGGSPGSNKKKKKHQKKSFLPSTPCPVCKCPSCRCGKFCTCVEGGCFCTEETLCCPASKVIESLGGPSLSSSSGSDIVGIVGGIGDAAAAPAGGCCSAKGKKVGPPLDPLSPTQSTQSTPTRENSSSFQVLDHGNPHSTSLSPTSPSSVINSKEEKKSRQKTMTAEFWIEGMTCGMCSQAIEAAVMQEFGPRRILHISISLTTDTALITWVVPSNTVAAVGEENETAAAAAAAGQSNNSHGNGGSKSDGNEDGGAEDVDDKFEKPSVEAITDAIEAVGYNVEQVRVEESSQNQSDFQNENGADLENNVSGEGQSDLVASAQHDYPTISASTSFNPSAPGNHNPRVSPSSSAQDRWDSLSKRQEAKVQRCRNAFLYSLAGSLPVLMLTMILPHLFPGFVHTLEATIVVEIGSKTLSLETMLLLLLATPVQFISGWSFYKMAYHGIRSGRAGMDVLVALGTTASYGYALVEGVIKGDVHAVHFFETSVTLISFVLLGKWMQVAAVRKTSAALSHLLSLQPKTAIKVIPFKDRQHFDPQIDPYREEILPVDQVHAGDLIKVIRGASIPADGRIVFGEVSIDESMVTGESMPVLKTPGSFVLGGTICVETSSYSQARSMAMASPTTTTSALTGGNANRNSTLGSIAEAESDSMMSARRQDEQQKEKQEQEGKQYIGAAFIHVTGVGSSTALAQIVQLVQEAQTRSVPIQSYADSIAAVFVPFVCATALFTYLVWYALCSSGAVPSEWYTSKGEDAATFSLMFGVAVLVISCPCALGLATPTAVVVGTGVGAKLGVLMKGGEALEIASSVDCVVFDKTGTLTKGKPVLSDFFKLEDPPGLVLPTARNSKSGGDGNSDKNDKIEKSICTLQEYLVWLFASLERTSEHPLAKAVVEYASKKLDRQFLQAKPFMQPSDYKALTGRGASGVVEGVRVSVGNRTYARLLGMAIGPVIEECMTQLENEGMSAIMGAVNGTVCVVMGIADELKPGAKESIAYLREELNVDVWLVTGDNARTANAISEKLGLPNNRVISEALPAAKVEQVRKLQGEGRIVAMVGDGVNDSPALAQANVGIGLGTGTEIAAEASDIVLVKGHVTDVCTALHLSRAIFRRIQWNFVWSMMYNCLGIPVAAGVFYPLIHTRLPPTLAALAMALSSVSVVFSSLSLRLYIEPCVTIEQQAQREREIQRRRQRGRRRSLSSRPLRRRLRRRSAASSWDDFLFRGRGAGGGGRAERGRVSRGVYSPPQQESESNTQSGFDMDDEEALMSSSEMDQTDSTSCVDNRSSARLEVRR